MRDQGSIPDGLWAREVYMLPLVLSLRFQQFSFEGLYEKRSWGVVQAAFGKDYQEGHQAILFNVLLYNFYMHCLV